MTGTCLYSQHSGRLRQGHQEFKASLSHAGSLKQRSKLKPKQTKKYILIAQYCQEAQIVQTEETLCSKREETGEVQLHKGGEDWKEARGESGRVELEYLVLTQEGGEMLAGWGRGCPPASQCPPPP